MLTFQQKRAVFSSFPELTETRGSNGRINYEYRGSKRQRKMLARELVESGNGYVLGRYMDGYRLDSRGWINIKNFDEEELIAVITKAIKSMARP